MVLLQPHLLHPAALPSPCISSIIPLSASGEHMKGAVHLYEQLLSGNRPDGRKAGQSRMSVPSLAERKSGIVSRDQRWTHTKTRLNGFRLFTMAPYSLLGPLPLRKGDGSGEIPVYNSFKQGKQSSHSRGVYPEQEALGIFLWSLKSTEAINTRIGRSMA